MAKSTYDLSDQAGRKINSSADVDVHELDPENLQQFALRKERELYQEVTALTIPRHFRDPEKLPATTPRGTRILSWNQAASLEVGTLIVVVDEGQPFLAEISKARHAHSHRLMDETEDFTVRFRTGEEQSYNDLGTYSVGQQFRTATGREVRLWRGIR